MHHTHIIAAAVLASAGFTFAQDDKKTKPVPPPAPEAPAAPAPAATPENVSYAYGTMIARNLKQMGIKIDVAELAKGISDTLDGKEPRLSQEQVQQVLMAFQQEQSKTQESRREDMQKERAAEEKKAWDKALAGGNKTAVASRDYLTENGKRKEVKSTDSGLQYEVLKAGEGTKPIAKDTVTVHYKGTLIDGKEFDSSYKRNEPASFPLLGVIPGWTEGLQLMTTGSKYKFFIPSYLAYGEGGQGADIPGHSTLVFEVELLSIQGK